MTTEKEMKISDAALWAERNGISFPDMGPDEWMKFYDETDDKSMGVTGFRNDEQHYSKQLYLDMFRLANRMDSFSKDIKNEHIKEISSLIRNHSRYFLAFMHPDDIEATSATRTRSVTGGDD